MASQKVHVILPRRRSKSPSEHSSGVLRRTRGFHIADSSNRRRSSSDVHGVVHRVRGVGRGGHETGVGIDVSVGHQQDVGRRVRRAGRLLKGVPGGEAGGALGDPAFRHRARVDSS